MHRVRAALALPDAPGVTGDGVRVALIDSGADISHPDLTDRIDVSASTHYGLTIGLEDYAGHGTHICGIVAGTGTADPRYRGIAPGAELIMLKALPAGSRGVSDFVAQAVFDALDRDADIINYSAGQSGYQKGVSPPWKWPTVPDVVARAFQVAADAGVLCIAAAGNEGPKQGTINRPAILEQTLAVGVLTVNGKLLAEHSSRGPVFLDARLRPGEIVTADPTDTPLDLTKPDVVAPGWNDPPQGADPIGMTWSGPISTRSRSAERMVGVVPDDPDCLYAPFGGSSQAAAVATGLAALLLEFGRQLEFDWGPNRADSLRRLMILGSLRLPGYEPHEQGAGSLYWPKLGGALEECVDPNSNLAAIVREGAQLKGL